LPIRVYLEVRGALINLVGEHQGNFVCFLPNIFNYCENP